MKDHTTAPAPYEAPALEVLGTVHGLTQQSLGGLIEKRLGHSDGFLFMGQGITHLSN